MCNCMEEKIEKMKEVCGYDYVTPPVDLLSGRCFITFNVKEPGKKKEEISMLLSKCPFCGEPYEIKK